VERPFVTLLALSGIGLHKLFAFVGRPGLEVECEVYLHISLARICPNFHWASGELKVSWRASRHDKFYLFKVTFSTPYLCRRPTQRLQHKR
jgi:hypothetical protein